MTTQRTNYCILCDHSATKHGNGQNNIRVMSLKKAETKNTVRYTLHTHSQFIAECRFDSIIFISILHVIAELRLLAICIDKDSHKMSHYYCNQELVELLIFDARVTNTSYDTSHNFTFESEEARSLIKKYNAELRFVATMSGLTRWQFIHGEDEVEGDK